MERLEVDLPAQRLEEESMHQEANNRQTPPNWCRVFPRQPPANTTERGTHVLGNAFCGDQQTTPTAARTARTAPFLQPPAACCHTRARAMPSGMQPRSGAWTRGVGGEQASSKLQGVAAAWGFGSSTLAASVLASTCSSFKGLP